MLHIFLQFHAWLQTERRATAWYAPPVVNPPLAKTELCGEQGPRNLYGRDGKFSVTLKSGVEKRRFALPLLMT